MSPALRIFIRVIASWFLGFVLPLIIAVALSPNQKFTASAVLIIVFFSVLALACVAMYWLLEQLLMSIRLGRLSSVAGLLVSAIIYVSLPAEGLFPTATLEIIFVFLPGVVWLISFFVKRRTIERYVDEL